jgi:hypothetical protein
MTQTSLGSMSDDQLVDRFGAICVEQDQALLHSEIARFNRLYSKMAAIRDELKQRQGDRRRALVKLYDHPNAQVRLQAARATLAVAPKEARSVIETLANSRKYPQAGDAGMTLENLDSGFFKPT